MRASPQPSRRLEPAPPRSPLAWLLLLGLASPPVASAAEQSSSDSEGAEAEPEEQGEDELEARIQALEAEIQQLREELRQEESSRVIEQARIEAALPEETAPAPEEREYVEKGRSLQMMNPEISPAGDMMAMLTLDPGDDGMEVQTSLPLRFMGLHFQSVLDPFSYFKGAVSLHPEGAHLEELYIVWHDLPRLSFTFGRFREQFGVVNRWHLHACEQSTFPYAMTTVLGDEGLVGQGLSVEWTMPHLWAHANTLTLQLVQQDNGELFATGVQARPAALAHLKNYWDLNEDTYLELGLSDLWGVNFQSSEPAVDEGETGKGLPELGGDYGLTHVAGADLTLYWSPLQQSTYHSLTWRSELYLAQQQPSGASEPTNRWGAYSYVQGQWSQVLYTGVRGDYAVLPGEDQPLLGVTPYVTWWQSHFVYFRLEYSHVTGPTEMPEHRLSLQVDWAAGPHKHERY